jgi:hypothetical protein
MRFGATFLLVSALSVCCAGLSGAAAVETVVVTGPKNLDQSIRDFVHTYAKPTPLMGKMARWSKGAPLCPDAVGLTPDDNAFIVARIHQVADMVGAPFATKLPCRPNMVVMFTPKPQALLDMVRTEKPNLLGYHTVAQMEDMTKVSHPIQAWYATATRDYNGAVQLDDAQAFDACVDMYGAMRCGAAAKAGNLQDGMQSEMAAVTVVADTNQVAGLQIGALADYIAMLVLSQTQTFETCLPLASIANLMTPDCEGKKAQSLSESDLAYLKALYKIDANALGTLQTSKVSNEMRRTLGEAEAGKKP